jgi:hypothetical protein
LAGETEVLGEILPQRHFVHHKIPHDQTRARTPDRSGGKPATNRLSYGAALYFTVYNLINSIINFVCYATRFGLLTITRVLHIRSIVPYKLHYTMFTDFSLYGGTQLYGLIKVKLIALLVIMFKL